MNILILGAGVTGTTSAWFLRQAGHEVVVVERQAAAAMETSFANGGQISVSHAEPWANPQVISKVLRWLGKEDAPLVFRPRFDGPLLRWGWQFLRNCTVARTRANMRAIVNLALFSRDALRALRQRLGPEFGLAYDCLTRGILHLYTDEKEFAAAVRAARVMREFGLDRQPLDADACARIEPALSDVRPQLVGGDYTASDESGDAHRFTRELASRAAAAGVIFHYGRTVSALRMEAGRARGVMLTDGETLRADAIVLALGSYSAPFLRPCGVDLPIYPAKGYSATLTLSPETIAQGIAPTVSLTDDERKIVFSRLGNRLRVAGTAEFNGYDLDLNPVRCAALIQRARYLFPRLEFTGDPAFWCGLRPATPSNVPLIGQSPLPGLWLNTGHGTLGWTLACGSALALADLIAARRPDVDFPFLC
ncbi:MAG: D-amino acid dehydrogenase [Zoogloeaceae bacterium]|jgi:D-amino-acid dehydrogenase|nr:D-amino acid dehydrogenase [Zoogloeaceae bacterium]